MIEISFHKMELINFLNPLSAIVQLTYHVGCKPGVHRE